MLKFIVPGMKCGGCARKIEEAIKALDANARISIDLGAKSVGVESTASPIELKFALLQAGYVADPEVEGT